MNEFIKATTAEQWVARACGDEKNRHRFTPYVHVQNGFMYATDAIRCYWIASVFPDGSYDPVSFMPVNLGHVPDLSKFRAPLHKAQSVSLTDCCVKYEGNKKLSSVRMPSGPAVRTWHLIESFNGALPANIQYETGASANIGGVSEFGGWIIRSLKSDA